jgi:hypothetical protein
MRPATEYHLPSFFAGPFVDTSLPGQKRDASDPDFAG